MMKKKELLWGLLFITAAVLIVINQFGFFPGVNAFELVAVVLLGGLIIRSIFAIDFWGILMPLAVISIIFAEELNIKDFTPWPVLLTALFLSIGLSLIFRRNGLFVFNFGFGNSLSDTVINDQDSSIVNCSTSFGSCIKYVNSENFERANIKCSFGDVKVYFDNAQIPSGKADIYLDVSLGDVTLFIPKGWKLVNNVHVFLGDMKEHNMGENVDSPVVNLYGNINLGDTKIIFV